MPLTETAIRNAKSSVKPIKLFDGGGMFLLVSPNGSKWWRLKYRIGGKEKLLSLGVYKDVTLKRAREKREDTRRLIADGVDPGTKRIADKATKEHTFEAIAREWLAIQLVSHSDTLLYD